MESVDAAVTHVLRTTLAKAAKDQTLNPQPLQMPDDTTKVKKHIALMIDKLGKGARLIEGLPTNSAGKKGAKHGYHKLLIKGCYFFVKNVDPQVIIRSGSYVHFVLIMNINKIDYKNVIAVWF